MTTLEDNFGNFQAEAGRVGTSIYVIKSYVGSVFMVLIAAGLGWVAFLPLNTYTYTSTGKECAMTQDCTGADESCVNKMCSTTQTTTKRHYWLLIISFVLLCIAYFIVWEAKMVKEIITQDKNTQQVGGLIFEASLLSNLFKK